MKEAVFEDPAVPVRGIFAQADVSHDNYPRDILLDLLNRCLDDSVRTVGFGGELVTPRRDSEEENGRDPKIPDLLHLVRQAIDREMEVSRQGFNFFLHPFTMNDEERTDQVSYPYRRFACHIAEESITSQPS